VLAGRPDFSAGPYDYIFLKMWGQIYEVCERKSIRDIRRSISA